MFGACCSTRCQASPPGQGLHRCKPRGCLLRVAVLALHACPKCGVTLMCYCCLSHGAQASKKHTAPLHQREALLFTVLQQARARFGCIARFLSAPLLCMGSADVRPASTAKGKAQLVARLCMLRSADRVARATPHTRCWWRASSLPERLRLASPALCTGVQRGHRSRTEQS